MMISTWSVESIHTYEQAHTYFENTRYPARSKKWFEHQRPLRNTASPHLRIERGDYNGHKFYALCLYNTALVRYFEPNDAGEYAVWLLNHYSNSSQRFLSNAGWWNRKEFTKQDGDKFLLQLSAQESIASKLWGDPFTCKLVFDMHGKVIAEKSAHIPFTRKTSTDTHRAKRKQLREDLAPIFDMLEMQYQSFITGIEIDEHEGRPFSSRKYNLVSEQIKNRLREGGFSSLNADDLTTIMQYATDCCHNIAKSIVQRRAYNFNTGHTKWEEYVELKTQRKVPISGLTLESHSPEVIERLTPTWEDISKSVDSDLLYLAGLMSGDEFKPYPQLAKTYAIRCYNLKIESWEDIPNLLGVETYDKLVNRKGVVY